MNAIIEVSIPLDAEAARALATRERRLAAGRVLSAMLQPGGVRDVLAEAIAEAKQEALAKGLTDEMVDEELAAWRAERPG